MKIFYLLVILLISLPVLSQEFHCGTDLVMKRIYEKNPELKLRKQKQDETQRSGQRRPASSSTYIIPIVFHILHVGGVENISDEQVKDALRILNRDYAKNNPDTTDIILPFKNLADSTKIQFVLATKDPLGNCTNGIKHYYDPDTDWDDTSPTIFSHSWDPTKYLNVYIVRTITLTGGFGAAGYSHFPGTLLPGDPQDAIVVLNNYFGSVGTGSDFLSRVLTHEVGHWFNLYHVFGSNNGAAIDCSGDDFVNDTPPTIGYLNCPDHNVPSQYQTCTPGISENFQNYMDYSYCVRMFTQGQVSRMQAALQDTISGRDNLWTNSNLIATGVLNPTTLCLPIADFKYSRSKTCVGTPIVFKDATWNGEPSNYNWSFPGGTPSTSTFSAPIVTYSLPGLYSITYSTSNSAGSSSPLTKANIITVTNNTALYSNSWSEGFENLPLLNTNWTLVSSSGATRWEQSQDAAYTGLYSAKISPPNNTRKSVTAMISPAIDLSSITSPALSFKIATADVTPNHINILKVYSSIDCGDTWSVIYSKTGQALITSASAANDFVPNGHNEWRTELINLQQIASANYVTFKFEYTRDTIPVANNIFIDDINIYTSKTNSIKENVTDVLQHVNVFPVPSHAEINVEFILLTAEKVKFEVCDIFGRQLLKPIQIYYEAGNHVLKIEPKNDLSNGIYFLKLETDNTSFTEKIIIAEE